nr:reverse transcriptase domain-containing protein [Tanacetum cinerariifolium]
MFLGKYFPPSMVTKLRNEITNFRQRPDESLFEEWERCKHSIDCCPNHNMLPITQIDTFYNGLTLRHHDTINAPLAQWSESSSFITSFSNQEIVALKAEMAEINKNLMKVFQINQQVKVVTPICETYGGPQSYNDCPATVGQTQNTGRALIDVYKEELTFPVGKEAIRFYLDQTSRYSANYNDMTANQIDVIVMTCEEYSQEVLGFSDVIASGNPTPYYDAFISTSFSTLIPFVDSDFLLEEVNAFLALKDDPTSSGVDQSYCDTEGDIILLEAFLNDDPSLPPPTQGMYLPQVRKELKICKAKIDKSLIDEPPEVELKDLPPHLE